MEKISKGCQSKVKPSLCKPQMGFDVYLTVHHSADLFQLPT